MSILAELPEDILDWQQKDSLRSLSQHFIALNEDSDIQTTNEVGNDSVKTKKQKRKDGNDRGEASEDSDTQTTNEVDNDGVKAKKQRRKDENGANEEDVSSGRSIKEKKRKRKSKNDQIESNEEVATSGPVEGKKRKRKRKDDRSPKTRNPWNRVLNRQSLALHSEIHTHLTDHGPDALRFLTDDSVLTHRITQFSSESVGDAFIACYKYTLDLEDRSVNDTFRWCFSMLMVYDVVRLIFPNRAGRVGKSMQQELNSHLVEFLAPVLGSLDLTQDVALKQLNEWRIYGMKVDLLCTHFGPGSLFFLGDILSKDL